MDKMLRKFCSQEVQILIAKIEEDYTVFTDYNNAWRRLLEVERCRTRVENYCVRKVKDRAEKNHERQQYLARILIQQLAPQTIQELEDGAYLSAKQVNGLHQQLGMAAQQRYQNQLQNTYTIR
jgi:hypothetical protein